MSDLAWKQMTQAIADEDQKQQHQHNEHVPLCTTPALLTPEQVFQVHALDVGIMCPLCKIKDVMYDLLATRSADEGMTADCSCRQCHHRFRQRV